MMPGVSAAYIRVSSKTQSLAMQRDAIARYAAASGDEIVAWFEEQASAKTVDRPVLAELRRRARAGELSKVYVFRLDRLTRSGIRDMLTVLDDLRGAGCRVKSVTEAIELTGPFGDWFIAGIAVSAQLERQAIGERIAAARARVEARGGAWGRPRRMTPQQIETARKMRANGHTVRAVSKAIHVPLSTVARLVCQKTGKKWGTRTLARRERRRQKKREEAALAGVVEKKATPLSQ